MQNRYEELKAYIKELQGRLENTLDNIPENHSRRQYYVGQYDAISAIIAETKFLEGKDETNY